MANSVQILLSALSSLPASLSSFFSTTPIPAPTPPDSDAFSKGAVTEAFDLVRYFLLCPTRHIETTDLCKIIRNTEAYDGKNTPPRLFHVTVPAMAPISAEQAELWTEQYWPMAYKNTNPYGPHPSLVQRNTEEIEPYAGQWLALAQLAGKQISEKCLGENIGVVVVDHTKGAPEVIAVAGDCRWRLPNGNVAPHVGTGNVMAHAVQRAIAMVAKKRLRVGGTDPALLDRSLFCDNPLSEIEKDFFDKDNLLSSGYLCVDLDVYLTNEPCVMCSMAILHSRFRRCIFAKRMPRTGAMTADPAGKSSSGEDGLCTGLFWRPSELNWKFLAWEFQEDSAEWKAYAELETKLEHMGMESASRIPEIDDTLQV